MKTEDWDRIKAILKSLHGETQNVWVEKVLLYNLIIDSGWMSEKDLDAGIEKGKKHPQNIRLAKEHWADSEQTLAEIGLDEWLAEFEKRYPRTD
jgi:hypothetical protein